MNEKNNNQLVSASQTSCLSIIEKKDSLALVRFVKNLNELSGVDSQNQISKIVKEKGEDYALEQVIYLIKWINEAYTKGLSDNIIFEISLSILSDYWYLKIEDIALFASEFRKGHIVKVPYHLEMQHIYEGIQIFEQRTMLAIRKRHQDIKQNWAMERQPEMTQSERIGNLVKTIGKNL